MKSRRIVVIAGLCTSATLLAVGIAQAVRESAACLNDCVRLDRLADATRKSEVELMREYLGVLAPYWETIKDAVPEGAVLWAGSSVLSQAELYEFGRLIVPLMPRSCMFSDSRETTERIRRQSPGRRTFFVNVHPASVGRPPSGRDSTLGLEGLEIGEPILRTADLSIYEVLAH